MSPDRHGRGVGRRRSGRQRFALTRLPGTANLRHTPSAHNVGHRANALAAHIRHDVALGDLPPSHPPHRPPTARRPTSTAACAPSATAPTRWINAANAAEQIARANAELAGTLLGPQPTLVFATSLLRTTAGRKCWRRWPRPRGLHRRVYNQAVTEVDLQSITPLSLVPDKNRYELPLWAGLGQGEQADAARARLRSRAGRCASRSLAPAAVLMTALLRWLGCDLFIHGTGGGAEQAKKAVTTRSRRCGCACGWA